MLRKTHNKGALKFSAARAVQMFKAGKRVVDIAVAFGYPRGHGQNRCRAALIKAGVYQPKRAVTGNSKVAVMPKPVPGESQPDTLLRECMNVIDSRYAKLHGRARSGWKEKLAGMLLASTGATQAKKINPVTLPDAGKAA